MDCQKKKKQLTRALVWEEAMKHEPTMFGGRAAEGWALKMSRWYYKFLHREGISIKEKEIGGRGRPRSKPTGGIVSFRSPVRPSARPRSARACLTQERGARGVSPGV